MLRKFIHAIRNLDPFAMLNSDYPDGQFIFKESEFEEETFAAASFVAKYRRVSSLESIKEQLQQYSNGLKQQLYNIINRDYKDFITISTKLDGVDTRTSLLQKPLVDVRTDLSSLHEGILTGMQAIQEKVTHRVEVANRRKLVETFLQCLTRLEATESVLNASFVGQKQNAVAESGHSTARSSQRARLLRTMDRRLALAASGSSNGGDNPNDTSTVTSTSTSLLLLEKDVFVCSELERASSCLASVDGSLATLLHHINTAVSATSTDDNSQTHDDSVGADPSAHKQSPLQSRSAVLSMYKALEMQARAHRELLIGRVHSQLTHLLTNSLGGGGNGGGSATAAASASVDATTATAVAAGGSSSSAGRSPAALRSRSFAHCLRALCTLGKGEVAEELVRDTIVGPFLRSFLTVGRVDGKGGRGSYSGLEEALQSVLDTLAFKSGTNGGGDRAGSSGAAAATPSFLLTCLQVSEEVLAYAPSCDSEEDQPGEQGSSRGGSSKTKPVDPDTLLRPSPSTNSPNKNALPPSGGGGKAVDLLMHGVWRPLAELLKERFADMFSVGIPSTLSHCYRCLARFLQKLQALCGPSYAEGISKRLHHHSLVTSFFAQWKLDLYFQLRCKEVFHRADRACELTFRGGLLGGKKLIDELYPTKSEPSASTVSSSAGGVTSSMAASDVATLRAEVEKQLAFQAPIFTSFALELRTCLHPTVLLQPLVAKFLTLILRTLMRLEAHVALSCSVTTPSFSSKSDIEQLRLVYATVVPSSDSAGASVSGTPAGKRGPGATNTPAGAKTPATAAAATSSTSSTAALVISVLALEELLVVAGDLHLLETWLLSEFSTAAAAALGAKQSAGGSFQVDLQGVDAVRAALVRQTAKLQGARGEVWAKVTSLLGAECRKALGAVKTAVVSKYRMTNKPAPDTASAYVEAILQPLKKFLAQHSALCAKLCITSASGESAAHEGLRLWKVALAEEVSLSFVEQVSALIETVKQMDSTLQRRSRLQQTAAASSGASNSNMSDSEKIALQIRLDIEAYGRDLQQLGINSAEVPAFRKLSELSVETASN